VPKRNVGGNYWDAVLYNGAGNSISYCGGVSDMNLDPSSEVVVDTDIAELAPGSAVLLRSVELAPFWPYLREPDYDVRTVEVIYIGWSNIVAHATPSTLESTKPQIEAASRRQCSLFGGELTSGGKPFRP
jgi:hypothetical protein